MNAIFILSLKNRSEWYITSICSIYSRSHDYVNAIFILSLKNWSEWYITSLYYQDSPRTLWGSVKFRENVLNTIYYSDYLEFNAEPLLFLALATDLCQLRKNDLWPLKKHQKVTKRIKQWSKMELCSMKAFKMRHSGMSTSPWNHYHKGIAFFGSILRLNTISDMSTCRHIVPRMWLMLISI